MGPGSGHAGGDLRRPRHAHVRPAWRRTALTPVGWPWGGVAVAPKPGWLGPGPHAHAPHAQVVHPPQRPASAQVRAGRTVGLSAGAKPAIAPGASRAHPKAGGLVPESWPGLEATSGARLASDSLEAGVCSPAQARRLAAAHTGAILGLTGQPPEVWRAAERGLGAQTPPAQRSAWAPSPGEQRRDPLDRTTARAASPDWSPLPQGWSVAHAMRPGKPGQVACAPRDEGTNRHRGRLRPEPILAVVSAHGASEHPGPWTVDVLGAADRTGWCGQGVGIQGLGGWRVMAEHVGARLRCRDVGMRAPRRAAKRRGPACGEALVRLICHAGRTLFPPRPASAGR